MTVNGAPLPVVTRNPTGFWLMFPTKSSTKWRGQCLIPMHRPLSMESNYVIIGGDCAFEVWDIMNRSCVRTIGDISSVYASCSVNNIVAVCCHNQSLYIYDVKTWELVHSNN